jgi:hypothetical protein
VTGIADEFSGDHFSLWCRLVEEPDDRRRELRSAEDRIFSRVRTVATLIRLGRHVGLASLAGVITGVVVGGLLGRLVMRVSGFMAGPALVGVHTSNGNPVGDITFAGTLGLTLFVGLGTGFLGGVLYAAVEPWLQRLRPRHGLAYGAALLATFGFSVLDPSNIDFRRFGSPGVNVAMFATLFLAFGGGVAWLFDRLSAVSAGTGRAARTVDILAWLALIPAVVVTVIVISSITGLADPLLPILFTLGMAIAAFARWRRLPTPIGYAALAAPLMLGAARTLGGLPELLTGF